MKNELKQHILCALKEYRRNMQQIALLQYELQHRSKVSNSEIIEAMTLSRNIAILPTAGKVADKTYQVAITHEENTTTLNSECVTAILGQLNVLEIKTKRLQHCVEQLKAEQAQTINMIYFQAKSIKAVAVEMHVSERTVQRYRDAALDELVVLYEFLSHTSAL